MWLDMLSLWANELTFLPRSFLAWWLSRPMDMEKLSKKLNAFEYKSKEQFHEDVMVMIKNCQTYNTSDTTYYRCAQQIQVLLEKLMAQQFGDK